MKKSQMVLAVALFSMSALMGCGAGGANSFIKGATVQANTVNNEVFAEVTLEVDTGTIVLPSFNVPIVDPHNPLVELGSISLMDPLGAGTSTQISAFVNLTRVSKVQASDGHLLPNGTLIPVGGLSDVPVLAIPVGRNGVELYVALAKNVAVIGAAIPIQQFNSISQYVGGMDFFPSFNFGTVQGIAGIYTSVPSMNENGLALFVDASGVLPKSGLNPGSTLERVAVERVATVPSVKLAFTGSTPSRRQRNRVATALYNLGNDQGGAPVTVGK